MRRGMDVFCFYPAVGGRLSLGGYATLRMGRTPCG